MKISILFLFLLVFLVGCFSAKKIDTMEDRMTLLRENKNPNETRKAILGEDYFIEKYKSKKGFTTLTFQTIDNDRKEPAFFFCIIFNGLMFFNEPLKPISFYAIGGQKYDFNIGSPNFRTLKITNIKPQQGDSLVIKTELKDGIILY